MGEVRDRVKELRRVRAGDLRANPKNYRTHPAAQRNALRGILASVGYADALLARELPDGALELLDGHLRAEETPDTVVPVLVVDLDDSEADLVLSTHDPLAALAGTDQQRLASLLKGLRVADDGLSSLLGKLAEDNGLLLQADAFVPPPDEPADDAGPGTGIVSLKEDARFDSDNPWDIPTLRVDRLYAGPLPTCTWAPGRPPPSEGEVALFLVGTVGFSRELCEGGILGCFVDDSRLEKYWKNAVREVANFLAWGWRAVCSPDFSVWRDDPAALQIWNIYKARWCARYWQEAGLDVIPALNWADERSFDWCFAGLPSPCPVAAVQARTTRSRLGRSYFLKGLAAAIERVKPGALLVYGAEHRPWIEPSLPQGPEYVWLPSWTSARRRARRNPESEGASCD